MGFRRNRNQGTQAKKPAADKTQQAQKPQAQKPAASSSKSKTAHDQKVLDTHFFENGADQFGNGGKAPKGE